GCRGDWPVLNKAAAGVNVARHAKYSARERSISIPDILLILNKAAAGVNVARHAKYSARERSISIPDILLSYHNHTTLAAS
ncbi:hypothetical protein J6590_108053, partial [Homalodisca vitripennis]